MNNEEAFMAKPQTVNGKTDITTDADVSTRELTDKKLKPPRPKPPNPKPPEPPDEVYPAWEELEEYPPKVPATKIPAHTDLGIVMDTVLMVLLKGYGR